MYIGVDLGTTGCKCVLFDADGGEIAVFNEEYPLILHGSFIEQDAFLWWDIVKRGIINVTKKADTHNIRAISISAQGISFVPVDCNGKTLSNAISWLDTRADAETDALAERFTRETIFEKTGKMCDSSYTLPKLWWLKKHEAGLYGKAYRFLMPLDYLNLRLTGRMLTDYTMACGTMAYNVREKCWDRELLDFCGIDEQKLPDVGCIGDTVGTVLPETARELGISDGCEVVLGGQDQKLAAIGAGITDGSCTVSLGTATAITRVSDHFISGAVSQFRLDEHRFVSEAALMTSGAALKWLTETMFAAKDYREMDNLARTSEKGAHGVRFDTDFSNGAAISGMTLATTRGDIVYALYEGVCREVAAAIGEMGGSDTLKVFGGGSKSDIWCEILADRTGCTVEILDTPETASRGAAITASHGSIAPARVKRTIN